MKTEKNAIESVRSIKYICGTLELSRKQLAIIVNKSVNTLNQYSSNSKLLSHDDIAKVLRYVSSRQPKYQQYANQIIEELTANTTNQ